MSSHVLPAWAAHVAERPFRTDASRERRRAAEEAFTDRTGILPASVRKLEGLAVVAAILGVGFVAALAPSLSPPAPFGARILAGQRIIEQTSSAEAPDTWQPQLDRMLPIVPPRP